MKKIIIGSVGVVVLVGVVIFVMIGNLDKIIKGALEGVGSELLGVQVTVSEVELDIKSGTGQITGFAIANPSLAKLNAVSSSPKRAVTFPLFTKEPL